MCRVGFLRVMYFLALIVPVASHDCAPYRWSHLKWLNVAVVIWHTLPFLDRAPKVDESYSTEPNLNLLASDVVCTVVIFADNVADALDFCHLRVLQGSHTIGHHLMSDRLTTMSKYPCDRDRCR